MKIQTLELNKPEADETGVKRSFWKRQFQSEATAKQKIFDGLFGIVLPTACFFFDPIVFKGLRTALLGPFKPFAYTLSFVSVMALLAFMLWGEKLGWLNGFLSGLFAIGSLVSLILGIVLFPFSLFGLLVLIGVLGFTPLFTAFVFWRNSVRAYKTAYPSMGTEFLVRSFVLSAMFSLVLPSLINVKIQKGLETMKTGDVQTIRSTAQRFKYIAPLVNFDSLAGNHCDSDNNEKQKVLADVYRQLTGKSIERLDYIICNDF